MVSISLQYLQLVLKAGYIDLAPLDESHVAVTACKSPRDTSTATECTSREQKGWSCRSFGIS